MRKPRQHNTTTTTTTAHPPLSVALHIHDGEATPDWESLWRALLLPAHCPPRGHPEPSLPRLSEKADDDGTVTEGGACP